MSRFTANATAKAVTRVRPRLAAVAPASAASPAPVAADSLEHPLTRLALAIEARRGDDPNLSRTARLIAGGRTKIAKKLCEEAAEVALEAVKGKRADVIQESADLLYHLAIVWAAVGVTPADVWAEMSRREALLGIAEKPPKLRDPKPEPA